MTQRMAIYMQDRIDIREELDLALHMEDRGFSEIWQGDNRLARDCIVAMTAFLTHTRRIKVAAGVLPIWTRNPVVIAASFSTMWELGGKVDGQGRVMLGLGAWWEPIAGRVGVDLVRPLTAMRENIEAVRALFTMEPVTYDGDFVSLDGVSLDVVWGDTSPRDIPIYLGATGPRMLELAGEICDGVCLNYGVSVDYIRRAIALVEKGAERAGRSISDIDLPELIVVSMCDDDPDEALHEGKEAGRLLLRDGAPHHEGQRRQRGGGRAGQGADGVAGHRGGLRAGQRGDPVPRSCATSWPSAPPRTAAARCASTSTPG